MPELRDAAQFYSCDPAAEMLHVIARFFKIPTRLRRFVYPACAE